MSEVFQSQSFQSLEVYNRLAPLGLRFWDSVSGKIVGEGLTVTAYPLNHPQKAVKAFTNRSGVYVLHKLPGLRQIESAAGDAAFWANPPQKPFVVEVRDEAGLGFIPFEFQVNLPVKGIFEWHCWPNSAPVASPLNPLPIGIPLFSTTARRVPAGQAVIYAELWDAIANAPAAWALLEARSNGRAPIWGIADGKGRVSLIMPYPEPLAFEPPAANQSGKALTEQVWPLQLHAFYGVEQIVPVLPDLCETLRQPAATLWADAGRTGQLTRADLHFGQGLVLRSQNEEKGRLLITPAAG